MPLPGRISRPASRDTPTATTPDRQARPDRTVPLAASTAVRRGTAANVTRIIPVPYSPLIASTATMAITAWPRYRPVRLILAGSSGQVPDGHLTPGAVAALTATVETIVATSSQPVPGRVRSFVHSARS